MRVRMLSKYKSNIFENKILNETNEAHTRKCFDKSMV